MPILMPDAQLFLQPKLVLHKEHFLSQLERQIMMRSWMYIGLYVKCLLFLSHFNENQNVSINFYKNTKY